MRRNSVPRVRIPARQVPLQENTIRKLDFIFCMYGIKYKEEKSLNAKISGAVKRVFSNSEDMAITKAIQLTRRVSACFSLFDAAPLTCADSKRFTSALKCFADDIVETIREQPNNPFVLAIRTFQFQIEWNKLVECVRGQFLAGFGEIFTDELCLSNAQNIIVFLTKLRKARVMPTELNCLHDKSIQRAVVASIDAYVKFHQVRVTNKKRRPQPQRQML